jgi:hypothetical protein
MRRYISAAGVFFAVICLVWIARFALGIPVRVNGFDVPVSLTLVPIAVSGTFAVWAFRVMRSEKA